MGTYTLSISDKISENPSRRKMWFIARKVTGFSTSHCGFVPVEFVGFMPLFYSRYDIPEQTRHGLWCPIIIL